MPHIRPLFPENTGIRTFLVYSKLIVCDIVSDATGYSTKEIATIPDIVRPEDMEMADNLLPLEWVIRVGSKCVGLVEEQAKEIKKNILAKLPNAREIHFGIWLISPSDAFYVEHDPKKPES